MIKTRISVDFALPNGNTSVEAMQGDGATRTVAVMLLANKLRWEPPAGVDAALAYRQPDGHKGVYDKLADGSPAITISGNVASVVLIPQMLAVAGDVECQLIFNDSKLDRLTSFPFVLRVAKNDIAGAPPVQDYIRLKWLEDKLAEYWNPAQAVVDGIVPEVTQLKDAISNLRFGDPYDGVDLSVKFAEEISGYSDLGAWIKARIKAANFDGIHVNDYIPFTTTNGLSFKARVAGIDSYYEYGNSSVGHHMDFICDELWPTFKPINPVNYNNGLIPTENVTSDGSATQYVLTKPMYGVAKVTLSGTPLAGWTYDKDTYTLTFSEAPAAGTMVVTGTGSEYPWLASDAYLYVNSLAGHVANGTGVNPAIKRVDYTNDGIYHFLPDWLKGVIIEKRFMLNKRFSTSGVLSDENGWGWANLGKLWFPTEAEVYGSFVWGSKGGYGIGGSVQYPLFMGNMRRMKKRSGVFNSWWLLSPNISATGWCDSHANGFADYANASADWRAAPVCFRIG